MPPLRCAEAMRRGATELASVQLVVGVHTTPARERRQAIRGTWARWRRTTLVCFVVGTKWLPPSVLVPLEQEAEEAGDMVLLHDVFEADHRSLTRVDTGSNTADIFTKPLAPKLFTKFRKAIMGETSYDDSMLIK